MMIERQKFLNLKLVEEIFADVVQLYKARIISINKKYYFKW